MTSADFKQIFDACDLTQEAFAARLGVRQPLISMWLNGRDVPDRYAVKLGILAATATGVSREQQREAAAADIKKIQAYLAAIETLRPVFDLSDLASDLSAELLAAQERLAELEAGK